MKFSFSVRPVVQKDWNMLKKRDERETLESIGHQIYFLMSF